MYTTFYMQKQVHQKGWFWDDVNKRMYRWHDLQLLMKERAVKIERKGLHKQNPQKTS